MQLKPGTELQNGKYRIIKTLGQGGFGITYEAKHTVLDQTLAVKEFFMKDICNREGDTSFVTVPSVGSKALVDKFKKKFVKEAQMIFGYSHPNIIRVLDVFEENGTAYYVMENLPGGSLYDKVKKDGPLSEAKAEKYIRQVADALSYIHAQNTVHLDVKPSNILLNAKGDAVLIDFGISKHYDDAGEQTSSTPVGISKGYAPLEQGRDGDISQFKPSTDIYALGATLYHLVTGSIPPEASIIYEDGLERPKGISDKIWNVIEQAMQPRRKDRLQTVEAFLALLDADFESTIVDPAPEPISKPNPKPKPKPAPKSQSPKSTPEKQKSKTWLWILLGAAVVAAIIAAIVLGGQKEKPSIDELILPVDTTAVAEPVVEQTQAPAPEPAVSGSLKVTSTPSGATIWLDGKKMKDTTPATLADLTPGKHSVKLVREGFNDLSGSVTITNGKQTNWSKTLTAKEKPAQTAAPANHEVEEESIPYALVEERPSFQGGDANTFSAWVNRHLVYPEEAQNNGIEGRVTLQFMINTDGSVSNVKVISGVDPLLDEEAVRVVSMSPKWSPGKQRNRPVKVVYNFPVIFKLR